MIPRICLVMYTIRRPINKLSANAFITWCNKFWKIFTESVLYMYTIFGNSTTNGLKIYFHLNRKMVRSTAAGYVRFSFVEDDFLNFLQYRGIFRFNARERKFTAKFTIYLFNLYQLKAAINVNKSCAMQCLQFSSLFLSNTYVVKICHSLLNRKFLDHLKILLFKYLSTRPRQLR